MQSEEEFSDDGKRKCMHEDILLGKQRA